MRFLKFSFLALFLRALPGQDLGTLTVYGGGTGFFPMPEPLDSSAFVFPVSIPAEPPATLVLVAPEFAPFVSPASITAQVPTHAILVVPDDSNVLPFLGRGWRASLGSDLHTTVVSVENRWFLLEGTRDGEGRNSGGLWLGWLGDTSWGIWNAETSARLLPDGMQFWEVAGSSTFDWEGHRFLGGLGLRSPGLIQPLLGWQWYGQVFSAGLRYATDAEGQGQIRLESRLGQDAGIQAATVFVTPTALWKSFSLAGWLPVTEEISAALRGTWTNRLKSSVLRVVLDVEYSRGLSLGLSGGASWQTDRVVPEVEARATLAWMEWVASFYGETRPRFKVQGAVSW